jgi:hypothetical protein
MDMSSTLGKAVLEARRRRQQERTQVAPESPGRESSPTKESLPATGINLATLQAEALARRGLETPSEAYERRKREREEKFRQELLAEQEAERREREEAERRAQLRYGVIEEIQTDLLPLIKDYKERLANALSGYILATEALERLSALEVIQNSLSLLEDIRKALENSLERVMEKGGIEADKEIVMEATTSPESIKDFVWDKIDLLYQTAQEIPVGFGTAYGREIQQSLRNIFEYATQYFNYPPTEIQIEMDISGDVDLARGMATESQPGPSSYRTLFTRETFPNPYSITPAPSQRSPIRSQREFTPTQRSPIPSRMSSGRFSIPLERSTIFREEPDALSRARSFILDHPQLSPMELTQALKNQGLDDLSITLALSEFESMPTRTSTRSPTRTFTRSPTRTSTRSPTRTSTRSLANLANPITPGTTLGGVPGPKITTRRTTLSNRSPTRARTTTPATTNLTQLLQSRSAADLKKIATQVGINNKLKKRELISELVASVAPDRLRELVSRYSILKSYRSCLGE